ncbi:hypothetical protein [Chelativorans sp. AA-79]|nr:hypothetical protein [Chelativorans sp. AA-79]WEX09841.1 hypothetical protein PVE73_02410 [Chelativorans sp. AA-79]
MIGQTAGGSSQAKPSCRVYVGQGRYLPARVRAFLDFLVANVKGG